MDEKLAKLMKDGWSYRKRVSGGSSGDNSELLAQIQNLQNENTNLANELETLDTQVAVMVGELDGVVTGGGGYKTASGTIVLDADAPYIKVTGLEFTPIAFVVVPTTIIVTSTVGAVFARGAGGLWRTGTGNMNLAVMAHKLELDGYTVYPDDSEFGGVVGSNYYDAVRVFDSGFGFHQYNGGFPIRAGTALEWWAIGE